MSRATAILFAIVCYAIFFATFLYLVGFIGDFAVIAKTVDRPGASVGVGGAVIIDLALIALFGVQHSVMARPGFKKAWTKIVPTVAERSVYVLLASIALMVMFAFWQPIDAIVWNAVSPLARGVLSGKYAAGAVPPEGSRAARNDKRIMQTEFRAESLALAQQMAERARARGVAPTAFALGWVWNNRLVHGVIAGPKTLAQWQGYVEAWGRPFSADDEAFVDALVVAGHASTPHYTDPQYPVEGRVPKTG